MSLKNISFLLLAFVFGFCWWWLFLGAVFVSVLVCFVFFLILFVCCFGSHVTKYILWKCWQWKKLFSQMQMFCQENRDCEGLPWNSVSTTGHEKHFCALWCSHAPFFRMVQPVLPLLLLWERRFVQPRDKSHPQPQILHSWRPKSLVRKWDVSKSQYVVAEQEIFESEENFYRILAEKTGTKWFSPIT